MKTLLVVSLALLLLGSAAAGTYAMTMGSSTAAAAPPSGDWPTLDDALHHLHRLGEIRIVNASQFDAAHGVSDGNGTPSDPYVIQNVYAQSLVIRNVSAAITIRHVYVSGALVLDWTGPGARVERSSIGEMSSNGNQPHTAPATWLTLVGNRIGTLTTRHSGGEVTENDIGPEGPLDATRLSFDVQGYDGYRIAGNTVRGPVEIRLHGHHFSDSFEMAWMPMDEMGGGATERYHAIVVVDNTFIDPTGRGVSISDAAHAANDRTAKSEPDPALNGTHRHFTSIVFDRNEIRGAGLVIEKADAKDPHHLDGGITTIHLGHDTVVDPLRGIGLLIDGSHGANITIEGGSLRMGGDVNASIGLLARHVEGGSVLVSDLKIVGFETTVKKQHVTKATTWRVDGDGADGASMKM